jgi:hypothetical protein
MRAPSMRVRVATVTASRPHSRVWFSPHGTEWEAESYEEALEMERDSLVEQLQTCERDRAQECVWRVEAEGNVRDLNEQLQTAEEARAMWEHALMVLTHDPGIPPDSPYLAEAKELLASKGSTPARES